MPFCFTMFRMQHKKKISKPQNSFTANIIVKPAARGTVFNSSGVSSFTVFSVNQRESPDLEFKLYKYTNDPRHI